MAIDVSYSLSLSFIQNGNTATHTKRGTKTLTGDNLAQVTQAIGTTAEVLSFGDISGTPQLVLIENLDTTNYVEIGGDSGLTVFKLKIPAGQSIVVSLTSGTAYAKANTAEVKVLMVAVGS